MAAASFDVVLLYAKFFCEGLEPSDAEIRWRSAPRDRPRRLLCTFNFPSAAAASFDAVLFLCKFFQKTAARRKTIRQPVLFPDSVPAPPSCRLRFLFREFSAESPLFPGFSCLGSYFPSPYYLEFIGIIYNLFKYTIKIPGFAPRQEDTEFSHPDTENSVAFRHGKWYYDC